MPVIILSALQILLVLILVTTLIVRYYYYHHYRDKETGTDRTVCSRPHVSEWWSWNSKPSNLAPEPLTLTTRSIPLALDLNTLEVTLEIKH